MIATDCNDHSLLIFEEKWPDYASGPKSAPKNNSFWVRWLFNEIARVFCCINVTILLLYTPAKIKMSFIWKDLFFLPKSESSLNRSQAHLSKQRRIGRSIGFNFWTKWTLYGNMKRFLCKIRLFEKSPKCLIIQNDGELMLMALRARSLPQYFRVYALFWLFTLWFLDEDASFFYFFQKITKIRSWWCFSSSKIRTQFSHAFRNNSMIFKVMSQYISALLKRKVDHIRSAEG